MLSNDADLKTILNQLTLEEKVGQLLMIRPREESIREPTAHAVGYCYVALPGCM
jgi:hypothetical protein